MLAFLSNFNPYFFQYFSEPCATLALLPPSAHSKIFGELLALAALNTELLNTLTSKIHQDVQDSRLYNQTSDAHPASSKSNQAELIDHNGTYDNICDMKSQQNDTHSSNHVLMCETSKINQSNCYHTEETKDFNSGKYNEIAQKRVPQSTNDDFYSSLFLRIDVGAAFLKIAPFLKAYSSYATKYQQSLDLIEVSCSKLFISIVRLRTCCTINCYGGMCNWNFVQSF